MATKDINWNIIKLTEIYESFDLVLRLLDEDFERARKIIDAAIKHGANAESMTQPIEEFAMELYAYVESIEQLEPKKLNTIQKS